MQHLRLRIAIMLVKAVHQYFLLKQFVGLLTFRYRAPEHKPYILAAVISWAVIPLHHLTVIHVPLTVNFPVR